VERVVHRALEKDPERRFQSALDLSHELDIALSTHERPWWQPRWNWPHRGARRSDGMGMGLIVLVALACAGIAAFLLSRH
jgi:hypothetical protein